MTEHHFVLGLVQRQFFSLGSDIQQLDLSTNDVIWKWNQQIQKPQCIYDLNNLIVIGFINGETIYIDKRSNTIVDRYISHVGGVIQIKGFEDHIVSCGKDNVLRLWDLRKNGHEMDRRCHGGDILGFDMCNRRVCSYATDNTVVLTMCSKGNLREPFLLMRTEENINEVSMNNERVVAACVNGDLSSHQDQEQKRRNLVFNSIKKSLKYYQRYHLRHVAFVLFFIVIHSYEIIQHSKLYNYWTLTQSLTTGNLNGENCSIITFPTTVNFVRPIEINNYFNTLEIVGYSKNDSYKTDRYTQDLSVTIDSKIIDFEVVSNYKNTVFIDISNFTTLKQITITSGDDFDFYLTDMLLKENKAEDNGKCTVEDGSGSKMIAIMILILVVMII
ncbi:hypothetical protein QTN25_000949 [Entamoeba marina]